MPSGRGRGRETGSRRAGGRGWGQRGTGDVAANDTVAGFSRYTALQSRRTGSAGELGTRTLEGAGVWSRGPTRTPCFLRCPEIVINVTLIIFSQIFLNCLSTTALSSVPSLRYRQVAGHEVEF